MDEEEIFADSDSHADLLTRGGEFFSNYKWIMLAGALVIGMLWPKIQIYLDKLYDKYESRRLAAKYHKNPDLALERLEGLQLARQRMQEELNRKAKEYEEKQKEKELQKAKERIAKAEENNKGRRLGDGTGTSRSDYNPLMGDTTRGYRAPKKSGCPGGGCGR